jgi:PAS domain S-box-containing protein
MVDAGPAQGSALDLVVRAGQVVTAVEAQRLVAELRRQPGVRAAAIVPGAAEPTDERRPTDPAQVPARDDLVLCVPVGAPAWRQQLRVEFAEPAAYQSLAPVAEELAAAAERALGQVCRPAPLNAGTNSALLRAITYGARALIVAVDPAAGWCAMSDSFATLLGYDRENPPNVRLVELIHPDDRADAITTFLTCCGGRHPTETVDLRVRTSTGRWRTLEVAARTFVDDADVGVVVFFAIDVSRQRETERTVLLEQQRLTKLVATMRDGIVLLDEGKRVCLTNEAARRLLALDEPGHDWAALLATLRERGLAETTLARLHRTIHSDQPVVGEEVSFGDGRVVELDFVPMAAEGRPLGVLVHVRDVTARVAVRRGLEERSRGLEERNRALVEASALNNEFIATVSHELRGPLSSVVAFSHLLGEAEAGALSAEQRTYLDVIDRNASRLLRLIEDLLLLSRLESRTLQLKPVATYLPDLVAAAVAERMPAAATAGVALAEETTDGPDLVCDDTRIHQVVDNLINNAVKFTPAGGQVMVRTRPDGDRWTVEVADSGVGIPESDLPRLFSAFFRGANVSSAVGRQVVPGTGLGLAVSRAIVELHGGTVHVASTEGVGTTVTLSLPARPTRNGG